MKLSSNTIQKQYDGFLKTPHLWHGNVIYGLNQFEIEQKSTVFNLKINPKIRLGKYVERFVSFQLQQVASLEIISENIQIQKEKITLGELDCILLSNEKPIHLEIIYKFYLFDPKISKNEIECFIGPNKKDSLVEKLNKLKEKQLPLLYSKECLSYLKEIHLNSEEIMQEVYFKAQLFVPYSNQNITFKNINTDCIAGYYINKNELSQFNDCKFHIPNKKDWLIIPETNANWLNFNDFLRESEKYLKRQFSPLCWLKKQNGEIDKLFLIWW